VRRAPICGIFLGVVLWQSPSDAAPVTAPAVARGENGQRTLAVGFDGQGRLRAAVCEKAPCALDVATEIPAPESVAKRATAARLTIVGIGGGRRAIVVEVPEVEPGKSWGAVLAGPFTGDKPVVSFSGYTGFVEGLEGERTGPMVLISDGVYVGTEREGSDLCGRRAMLSPKALDPKTLGLVPVKLQRLTEKERDAAVAAVVEPSSGAPSPPLLRPIWATSAATGTAVAHLADGKPETVWAEGKSGVGRGEFAIFRSPREVPIAAFELSVRSAKGPEPEAVPRDLYLVTDHETYRVTLPADAAQTAGARYDVKLPTPVRTGCVGLVLESAFIDDKASRVGIAEFNAKPALPTNPAELIEKIAAGGPDAEAAGSMLRVADKAALEALSVRFPSLDENARRIALDVLDDAPCDVAVPAYLAALAGPVEAQRIHVRNVFPRCSGVSSSAIGAALSKLSGGARAALVDELAGLAPAALTSTLLPMIDTAKVVDRRAYRAGLARASAATEAHGLIAKALSGAELGTVGTIDVLRALGDSLPGYGDAAHAALVRVLGGKASFRSRFLLLGPAAVLAPSDASARAYLRSSIASDSDARIRAEASRSVQTPKLYYAELARGLEDRAVRVREAAASALGAGHVDESGAALAYRLTQDSWPLVRRAAAHALGDLAPNPTIDSGLGRALQDESADVRREVLHAIGLRRAGSQVELVRERWNDREEVDSVRAAAAIALGKVCDVASLDSLTERAQKIAMPMNDDSDRVIGRGALTALSIMAPRDLKQRLKPFWAKGVPRSISELATAAVASRGECGMVVAPRRNASR
jgi:HEAT repeats